MAAPAIPTGPTGRRLARAGLTAAILALALQLAGLTASRATGLIADLSHHLIAITTAFTGSDVLVFGNVQTPGSEVAILVRGPAGTVAVRRKQRIGIAWLNTREVAFENVPGFYAVAASAPLAELAAEDELRRYQVGPSRLRLQPAAGVQLSPAELAAFREALVRNKQRQGLFSDRVQRVTFLDERLFRTTLGFPAATPPGPYQVQVLEFQDGIVTGAQSSTLVVSKVGIEAQLYTFARDHALLYGLAAVMLAVLAGWSANLLFQKR